MTGFEGRREVEVRVGAELEEEVCAVDYKEDAVRDEMGVSELGGEGGKQQDEQSDTATETQHVGVGRGKTLSAEVGDEGVVADGDDAE